MEGERFQQVTFGGIALSWLVTVGFVPCTFSVERVAPISRGR
jgi:hypothetical protein